MRFAHRSHEKQVNWLSSLNCNSTPDFTQTRAIGRRIQSHLICGRTNHVVPDIMEFGSILYQIFNHILMSESQFHVSRLHSCSAKLSLITSVDKVGEVMFPVAFVYVCLFVCVLVCWFVYPDDNLTSAVGRRIQSRAWVVICIHFFLSNVRPSIKTIQWDPCIIKYFASLCITLRTEYAAGYPAGHPDRV